MGVRVSGGWNQDAGHGGRMREARIELARMGERSQRAAARESGEAPTRVGDVVQEEARCVRLEV